MSMYNYSFCCELVFSLSWVTLKRRAELHIDTKNKVEGADQAGGEMIQFSDACS